MGWLLRQSWGNPPPPVVWQGSSFYLVLIGNKLFDWQRGKCTVEFCINYIVDNCLLQLQQRLPLPHLPSHANSLQSQLHTGYLSLPFITSVEKSHHSENGKCSISRIFLIGFNFEQRLFYMVLFHQVLNHTVKLIMVDPRHTLEEILKPDILDCASSKPEDLRI